MSPHRWPPDDDEVDPVVVEAADYARELRLEGWEMPAAAFKAAREHGVDASEVLAECGRRGGIRSARRRGWSDPGPMAGQSCRCRPSVTVGDGLCALCGGRVAP